MSIAIKLNTSERIRRAKAADPSLSDEQLCQRLGVNIHQIKAAMAYKQPGQKPGRRRA